MNTENLSTLKIHKLSQEQYDREKDAGNIEETALYLTPDNEADFVVEQGTKDGWIYRKWYSGIAECWATISVPKDEITAQAVAENGIFNCSYRINPLPFQFAREEMCGVVQPLTISGSVINSYANYVVPCCGYMECPWYVDDVGNPVSNQAIKICFDLLGCDANGDGAVSWMEQDHGGFTLCIHIIDRWK